MQNKSRGKTVILRQNENISQALRRFKKKVEESNVLEDVLKKEYYEKPTTARKRKADAAKARWQRLLRENDTPKKMY